MIIWIEHFEELKNKFDCEKITEEEFEEIDNNPNCYKECNGISGLYRGYNWYTVYKYDFEAEEKLSDEFSIYVKTS